MKTLPLKAGLILLGFFQIFTILTKWGEDTRGTIIASLILVGCILLLMTDVSFNRDNRKTFTK
ncbi:hypothetical protein SAMN05518871_104244 [Psychrobacillus sp. OK028]|uniref:hypothetical protein n=1 Tax=Psychrobacillus sp. OK028 TaxID=1884359 RepID=UPI000889F049|nr:hypothetical protein [Psychrobacillus sp. OK028]SDN31714.1 hypothetical protein SAMN05518871_104244 [Psychrobacillus sp. OK028]